MAEFIPLFGIRTTTAGDVVTVSVLGEVDLATVDRLRQALDDALACAGHVVCDLTPVSFLGCSGLSALLDAQETLTRHGARFEILANSRVVLRPIRLTGLLDRLPVRPDPSTVDDRRECASPGDDGKVGG